MKRNNKNTGEKLSVYDYTDVRTYLADYYQSQKKLGTGFSYRSFSEQTGLNSVGLYKDVVEGRQKLGRNLIQKFSQALGHGKRESEYFAHMVQFSDSKTASDRNTNFKKMMACYESTAYKVESDKFEYYSKWYYSAVRALVSIIPVKKNFKEIARSLNPPIRTDQAEKAVKVLAKLGFIKKKNDGYFEVSEPVITSGSPAEQDQLQLFHLINYQKAMIKLAGESYDINALRNIAMSTLTLSLSKESFLLISKEIADVRKKIAGIAESDQNPDRLYQLSYKLFPLTKIKEDDPDTKKPKEKAPK